MMKLWSICRNTFTQAIRQPIFGIIVLGTFLVFPIVLPISGWTMGSEWRTTDQLLFETTGLSVLLVSGLLVAVFTAPAVLAREIEDRTALTVISKPVPRSTFVVGKFFGVAGAVTVAFYLCSLVFLMAVRHKVMPTVSDPYDIPVITLGVGSVALSLIVAIVGNIMFGWTFISAAVWSALILMSVAMSVIGFVDKGWEIVQFGKDIRPELLPAILLLYMAVMILTAVAVVVSTRLGQILTLLVSVGVFVVGSMHPSLIGRWGESIPAVRVLGWLVVDLTKFYPMDALILEKPYDITYVGLAGARSAAYVIALLALGAALFQRRQLDAEEGSAAMPGAVASLAWAGRLAAIAAGIIAAMMLSLARYHNAAGLATAAALLVGAALLWLLMGFVGRGVKWSYWLVLTITAVVLIRAAAILVAPSALAAIRFEGSLVQVTVEALVSAAVLLVLLLPKTRHHFQSAR